MDDSLDTATLILFLVTGIPFALLAASRLPMVWHAGPKTLETPEKWPWSAVIWRGMVRSAPLSYAFIVIMVPAGVVNQLFFRGDGGNFETVIGALFVAIVALILSVFFFNHPKIFVPPALRERPGATAEWESIAAERRHGDQ